MGISDPVRGLAVPQSHADLVLQMWRQLARHCQERNEVATLPKKGDRK
jgi:hypothetical protein